MIFSFLLSPNLAFSGKEVDTYQLAITSRPVTFDPSKVTDTSSGTIIIQLFDPLFVRNYDGSITEALIEHYDISESRNVYTFYLKKEIFFHNGDPITSYDVLGSLKDKIMFSRNEQQLNVVKGVADFQKGKRNYISGIKVVSEKIFSIELNNPFPHFIEMLSDMSYSIKPKNYEQLEKRGLIVGSGPYRFVEQLGDEVHLQKFNLYWKKDRIVNNIIFRVVKDYNQASDLIGKGLLDNSHPFVLKSPPGLGWKGYSYMHACVRFFGFNTNANYPFQNLKVREALLSVLPINEYHLKLTSNKKIPISRLVPPGLPGYIPKNWLAPMAFDDAVKVIRATKWGHKFKVYNHMLDDEEFVKVIKDICKQWQKLGVPCEYEEVTLAQYVKLLHGGKLEVFVGKLMPHVPDTYWVLATLHSGSMNNSTGTNSPTIDSLLDLSLNTEDPAKRVVYFEKINDEIYRRMVIIPLKYMGYQTYYVRNIFILPPIDVTGPFFMRLNKISVKGI